MRHLRTILIALLSGPSIVASAQTTAEDSAAVIAKAFAAMFGGEDVPVEPLYHFEHSVKYATSKTGWDGETQREESELLFSGGSSRLAMKAQKVEEGRTMDMFLVFDGATRNSLNFMHSDTMNVCMRMKIPDFGKDGGTREKKHLLATGERRSIAGHDAAEWLYDDGSEEIRIWLADLPGVDLAPMHKALGRVHGMPVLADGDQPSGVLLAYSEKRKDADAPHETMEAQEVRLNTPVEFATAGYRIIM